MSAEHATTFFQKFEMDETMRNEWRITSSVDTVPELLAFAKQKGFEFSVEDLREALRVMPADSYTRRMFGE